MFSLKYLIVASSLITAGLTEYQLNEIVYNGEDSELPHNIEAVNYRLPNHIYPETYDLSLWTRLDLDDFDYQGVVKIGIAVSHPTRQIVLHKSQWTIVDVKLTMVNGSDPIEVPLSVYTFDAVTELLTIPTNGTILNAGERLVLEIRFINTFAIDGRGFFRQSYEDPEGNKM